MLRPIKHKRVFRVAPEANGSFGENATAEIAQALASGEGETHEIHPRLARLMYRAARRFRAPYVYVISGYRATRPTSRHRHGRAVDFVLPGVPDRRLAAYLRRQGFVGVGLYPVSGFVHLDVRARSYFWIDRSGPGRTNRPRTILRKAARRFDARARRKGVEPPAPLDDAAPSEDIEVPQSAEERVD